MTEIKLIECPRDAWQGLRGQIPSYIKIDYLKALISAGFKHLVCRLLLEKKKKKKKTFADSLDEKIKLKEAYEKILQTRTEISAHFSCVLYHIANMHSRYMT